jgi:succinate dehydrogenase / fumarate reductase, iron-sulfur subunit
MSPSIRNTVRRHPEGITIGLVMLISLAFAVITQGGWVSIGNLQSMSQVTAVLAIMAFGEAAACIGCGGCVAACPNSSAMLFVAAKVSDLGLLPQGQAERNKRMVRKMNELGFGNCRNHYECEAACPAEINAMFISRLNRDYVVAVTREAVAV